MGGPACSIPVREPPTVAQLRQMLKWLHGVSDQADKGYRVFREDKDVWHFSVADSTRLGFEGEIESAEPFALTLEETRSEESIPWSYGFTDRNGRYYDAYILKQGLEHERQQWLAHVGYFPAHRLLLEAFCNRSIDHRLLAHMALYLAGCFDGLIDMCGKLTPPYSGPLLSRKASPEERRLWIDRNLKPPPEEIHQYVQGLPGHVYEFTRFDFLENQLSSVRHVLDSDALRGWMQRPNFHMIK